MKKKLPRFKSKRAAREFFDSTDSADYIDEDTIVFVKNTKNKVKEIWNKHLK